MEKTALEVLKEMFDADVNYFVSLQRRFGIGSPSVSSETRTALLVCFYSHSSLLVQEYEKRLEKLEKEVERLKAGKIKSEN